MFSFIRFSLVFSLITGGTFEAFEYIAARVFDPSRWYRAQSRPFLSFSPREEFVVGSLHNILLVMPEPVTTPVAYIDLRGVSSPQEFVSFTREIVFSEAHALEHSVHQDWVPPPLF